VSLDFLEILGRRKKNKISQGGVWADLTPPFVTVPSRQTRSAASPLLSGSRLTTDFARCLFSYAAPAIWNSLPTEVMLCDSEHSFKRHLKTYLFNSCHQTVWPIPHQHLCSLLLAYMALYKYYYKSSLMSSPIFSYFFFYLWISEKLKWFLFIRT